MGDRNGENGPNRRGGALFGVLALAFLAIYAAGGVLIWPVLGIDAVEMLDHVVLDWDHARGHTLLANAVWRLALEASGWNWIVADVSIRAAVFGAMLFFSWRAGSALNGSGGGMVAATGMACLIMTSTTLLISTHTLMTMAPCVAALDALARIAVRGETRARVIRLFLALTLAVAAKPSAILLVVASGVAVRTTPALRSRSLFAALSAVLLVAAAIYGVMEAGGYLTRAGRVFNPQGGDVSKFAMLFGSLWGKLNELCVFALVVAVLSRFVRGARFVFARVFVAYMLTYAVLLALLFGRVSGHHVMPGVIVAPIALAEAFALRRGAWRVIVAVFVIGVALFLHRMDGARDWRILSRRMDAVVAGVAGVAPGACVWGAAAPAWGRPVLIGNLNARLAPDRAVRGCDSHVYVWFVGRLGPGRPGAPPDPAVLSRLGAADPAPVHTGVGADGRPVAFYAVPSAALPRRILGEPRQ